MDLTHCKGSISIEPCYKLNKYQREAIGLLQIGTFLEYFDLMLYVHMSVVLNGLFFPKMDPKAEMAMAAMTFSSIYLLRPIGALIFGYIGDTIGRKTTIVITTGMMAVSCIVIATLPTYAEIGGKATLVFLLCRMLQGISSMGEVVGSQIYATELVQPPRRHLAVNLINLCTMIGGLAALCVTWYVVNIAGNWRIAFWIGSCIAVVGSIARIRLRETPEFVRHVKLSKTKDKFKTQCSNILEMFKQKTSWSFVSIMQAYQVSFFVAYGYFNVHLKSVFRLTPEQLVDHNLKISLFSVVFNCFITWLVTKYDPLKIYYTKTLIFILVFITSFFILIHDHSYVSLAIIQMMFISLGMDTMPTNGVTISNFHIANRFTTTAVLWALSRLTAHLIFVATLVWLTQYIGFYALLVVYTPLITLNMWGLFHYMNLENKRANAQKIFLRA